MSSEKQIHKRNCKKIPEYEELIKCAEVLGYSIEIDTVFSDKEHENDNRLFLNIRNKNKRLVASRKMENILELPQSSADILNEISK